MRVYHIFSSKNPNAITVNAMLETLYATKEEIGGESKIINGFTGNEIEFLEVEESFLKNGQEHQEHIVTLY